MSEITVKEVRIINAALLFVNTLSALDDITLPSDWSWEHMDTDTEEQTAFKTFVNFENTIINLKLTNSERLQAMKPLIEFIKTNNSILRETDYIENDWSKYVTDGSDIQKSLKTILSSFKIKKQTDSADKYLYKCRANNALKIIAQYFEREL